MNKLRDIIGTDRNIFFKAMFGFDPEEWGGINFQSVSNFMKKSKAGDLVAVYVTQDARDKDGKQQKDCGKIAGFYEVSRRKLCLKDCISPAKQTQFAEEIKNGKWRDCVKATKAWAIIAEDKASVELLLPETYSKPRARAISSTGEKLTDNEKNRMLELRVTERLVYSKDYSNGIITPALNKPPSAHKY